MRKSILLIISLCCLMLASCLKDDDGSIQPTDQLQDGDWTGTGEGHSGSIIAKVTVKNHQVELVTIVSQSESVFAQDAINMAILASMGKETEKTKIYTDGVCDIVIVGAGEAGLSAAVAASETNSDRT